MKQNIIRTIPVMTGYLVLGFGFGIVLRSKGFGILWCLALSTFVNAGSMQYVAVDLMAMGAGLLTTALFVCIFTEQWLAGKDHASLSSFFDFRERKTDFVTTFCQKQEK